MRKYQALWESIKNSNNNSTSVLAPISSHALIIEAVTTEKKKDLGWKLLLSEQGIKYKVMHHIKEEQITFYLQKVIPLINTL